MFGLQFCYPELFWFMGALIVSSFGKRKAKYTQTFKGFPGDWNLWGKGLGEGWMVPKTIFRVFFDFQKIFLKGRLESGFGSP